MTDYECMLRRLKILIDIPEGIRLDFNRMRECILNGDLGTAYHRLELISGCYESDEDLASVLRDLLDIGMVGMVNLQRGKSYSK